jgi:hypothetical protein
MDKRGLSNRGQVTIFVIVALIIVGAVLVFFLFPEANVFVSGDVNPTSFLKDCVKPKIDETIDVLKKQGGYLEPTNYVNYQGERIQYLCYSSENYRTCLVQQPLLIRHVEKELNNELKPVAEQCIRNLRDEYERKGYRVNVKQGNVKTNIVLDKMVIDFNYPMVIEKESVQSFDKFAVEIDSEFYSLLSLATNIIDFESSFGDSDVNLYLQYYPDLRIEKIKRNGDTIYIVSDVVSEEEFSFASRSLVWPQGYS